MKTNWSKQETDRLKEARAAGYSYDRCADLLLAEFGILRTPNACQAQAGIIGIAEKGAPAWPASHIEALKRHVANGLSFSRVASEILAEFGVSYSRNACIGKAMRLGLSAPNKNGPRADAVAHRLTVKAKEAATQRTVSRMKAKRFRSVDQDMRPLREAPTEPRHIGLLDLKSRDCRYPFGNGPFTFCGCPTVAKEESYCAEHYALTRSATLVPMGGA